MRRRVMGTAVSALLLAGAPGGPAHARATPADALLASFRSLCLATGGERAAALAAAEKAGWFPVPDDALAASAPRFEAPVGRLHTDADGFQFLILGGQVRTVGDRAVRMRACGVGASTTEAARLDAGAQEIAAVPRALHLSDAGQSVWAYAEEGARHAPLDDGDARRTAAALESGALRLLARHTRVTPGMPTGLSVLILNTPAR